MCSFGPLAGHTSALKQMKYVLHKTFSICQDWSTVLINNVLGGAHVCVHAQRVNTCTQVREVNKPSYLSKMKSDLHKTFSVCCDCSPVLINNVHGGAHACVHAQHVNKCTQLREVNKHSYLSQMKSDLHKTFSVCRDWSPVLINNVHGGAHACVHAQRVNTCTQLREVNKHSYLSQMKSDLHKTFSVCHDWSPVLINNVHGFHMCACTHSA